MLFAPVRLRSTALSAEVLTADVKNCKHFGPCGAGRGKSAVSERFPV